MSSHESITPSTHENPHESEYELLNTARFILDVLKGSLEVQRDLINEAERILREQDAVVEHLCEQSAKDSPESKDASRKLLNARIIRDQALEAYEHTLAGHKTIVQNISRLEQEVAEKEGSWKHVVS